MTRAKRLLGIVTGIVTIAFVVAACGNDATSGGGGGDGSAAPAAMEPFGAACADVPASGDGSFEGMMTEPVGTAAAANPMLTSLAMDLELAGLTDTLNNAEGLTVFAPTNDAFVEAADADPEAMEMMMQHPEEFADLLSYHVVEGQIPPEELAGDHTTLQGDPVTVEGGGEDFTVNGSANIVCGDIHTDNATVYVIDEVLHP